MLTVTGSEGAYTSPLLGDKEMSYWKGDMTSIALITSVKHLLNFFYKQHTLKQFAYIIIFNPQSKPIGYLLVLEIVVQKKKSWLAPSDSH